MAAQNQIIPMNKIAGRIRLVRGRKVILDHDLAELYEVTTGNLNKAVIRNLERFPDDFMFQLTNEELRNLIFQNGTSSWGGTRKLPRAFTEQGVAMLSGMLKSRQAIDVNIAIMRTFVKMREMIAEHAEIAEKLKALEDRMDENDISLATIMLVLRKLQEDKNRRKIGFDSN